MEIHQSTPYNYQNQDNSYLDTKIITLYPAEKSIVQLNKVSPMSTKLCISMAEGKVIIPISNILRLESASNYTTLYTLDGNKYIISKTMKTLQESLPEKQFIRCHNSHIVNRHEISSFKKGSLMLGCDIEIPIARQKYQSVVKDIEKYCISL